MAEKRKKTDPPIDEKTEIKDSDDDQPKRIKISDGNRYESLTHREHVLKLPDMYIGYARPTTIENMFVAKRDDNNDYTLVCKTINAVPALHKIFDEILMNAFDNVTRTRSYHTKDATVQLCNTIRVTIDQEKGTITVQNDGESIPVTKHEKHNIYIAELVFGRLLSSSNYNETHKKQWGGQNGIGSKATCIYSTKFVVETGDHRNKLSFKQTWKNNMSDPKNPPIIKPYEGKPFTKVTFTPDYARFGVEGLTDDIVAWMNRRVIDIAGCTPKEVGVYLNGRKIPVKTFTHYVSMYVASNESNPKVFYCEPCPNWEIAVCASPDHSFHQVSLVNGIFTNQGGKHVDHVASIIARKLSHALNEKRGSSGDLKPAHVRNNMWLFVNCLIPNPTFNSQTKECLTTVPKDFDAKVDIDDKFIAKLTKSDLAIRAQSLLRAAEDAKVARTDGKMTRTVTGVDKLDDANWAGTKKSSQCTLILTEGDSAKAMALSGLSIVGRDRYGVYPLRGKVVNVRDGKSASKVHDNKEIHNIKKILGLVQGTEYKDLSELRYGAVMIMTDADWDGSHIKGLLLNLFDTYWSSLLKLGFVFSLYTPAVKIKRGNRTVQSFYSILDYEKWKATQGGSIPVGLSVKHYKGLGTSTREEAREYFTKLATVKYSYDDGARAALTLAFGKDSQQRKDWLRQMDWNNSLDYGKRSVPITDFVNKELIYFSNSSNLRAIPSFCDGLKPVQRKVLYTALRMTHKEIKVGVLGGKVTSETAYHHGESSMVGTIVTMAQDFVGSNNLNLLHPEGQFGTRIAGGDDAAQARYVHTYLEPIVPYVFHPDDAALLRHELDDGKRIEPQWYMPIIPMVLVNGACGVGTGYSTNIPMHNPVDLIEWLMARLDRMEPTQPPHTTLPWFRHFKGRVVVEGNITYTVGVFKTAADLLTITELPIGTWTAKYESFLQDLRETPPPGMPKILKITKGNEHDDQRIQLFLRMENVDNSLNKWLADESAVLDALQLRESKTCKTSNMHLFTPMKKIMKFKSVDEIMEAFYRFRMIGYEKRKEYYTLYWKRELNVISQKIRFVEGVMDGQVVINRKSDSEIVAEMKRHNFPPNPHREQLDFKNASLVDYERAVRIDDNDIEFFEEKEDSGGNDDEKGDCDGDDEPSPVSNWNYLITMPISSMSSKKLKVLRDQQSTAEKKLAYYVERNAGDIWRDDLLALKNVLNKK